MAGVLSGEVQKLLDEIVKLKTTIESIGSIGKAALTKLADIITTETSIKPPIPLTKEGKLDDSEWSNRTQEEQNASYNRLINVRDSLRCAARLDGPTEEEHLMYGGMHGGYATTWSIQVCLTLSVFFVGILLSSIAFLWNQATSTDFAQKIKAAELAIKALTDLKEEVKTSQAEIQKKTATETGKPELSQKEGDQANKEQKMSGPETDLHQKQAAMESAEKKANAHAVEAIEAIGKNGATEQMVIIMVCLLGGLGGALHLVGSLVMYIGNGQLKRRWLPYYLSLPIVGAALAPIVYMLLRVGILTPTGIANGGTATSSLNLVAIYAFAALTGLFAKTATDKLSEVFATLFRTGEPAGKDKIGSGRATGVNT